MSLNLTLPELAQMDALYTDCRELEKSSRVKAEILKVITIVFSLVIISSGVIVSVLSSSSFRNKDIFIIILGVIISAIKIVMSTFSIENRTITFKQISVKLRRLAREIIKARTKGNHTKIDQMLPFLYQEFDELDLNAFSDGTADRLFRARYSPVPDMEQGRDDLTKLYPLSQLAISNSGFPVGKLSKQQEANNDRRENIFERREERPSGREDKPSGREDRPPERTLVEHMREQDTIIKVQ